MRPNAGAFLAAATLVLAGTAVAVAGGDRPAHAAGTPLRPPGGAAMIGWHEKGDNLDALRAHEALLGTRFAVVRLYQQWKTPSSKVAALAGEGRLVLVSHKPPAGGWAAVASGAEDAMIALLADRYRAYQRQVVFIFHHEPHDDAADLKGGAAGTSADYLAAWRRIHRIFAERGAHRSAGGNVWFGYSATGSWALKASPGGPAGSGDPLYPGSDVVDVLAHDRYNWASCRGDAWEEFEENWAPLVALAARTAKPLIAAEVGSAPAGGLRNDWFRRGAEWMRTDPVARRWMWGFAYYHSLHDTCPWDFLNHGDDGLLGWRDAFRDPYFTGTPFSLASDGLVGAVPSPAPAPVPTPATPAPAPAPAPSPAPAAPAKPAPAVVSAPTTIPPAPSPAEPAAGDDTPAASGDGAGPAPGETGPAGAGDVAATAEPGTGDATAAGDAAAGHPGRGEPGRPGGVLRLLPWLLAATAGVWAARRVAVG